MKKSQLKNKRKMNDKKADNRKKSNKQGEAKEEIKRKRSAFRESIRYIKPEIVKIMLIDFPRTSFFE